MFDEKDLMGPKKSNKYQNIVSLGSSLDLELILSLEEKQYESLGIKYNEIASIDDLKNFCPYPPGNRLKKLTSLIELHSSSYLFKSILFLNQSSKVKFPIKYLIPFSPKFPKELNYIYNIIKSITEINHIYIEDSNLLDIKPNIYFTLKLIENDTIVDKKSFLITNENHYQKDEDNKFDDYEGNLFEGLNFEYECDYFYTSIKDLNNCKKYSNKEVVKFIEKLITKFPKMKICINFNESYILSNKDFIKSIIADTDIFIFEKKDVLNFYNNLYNIKSDIKDNKLYIYNFNDSSTIHNNTLENFFFYKLKNAKFNQQIKIGMFINEMQEILLLQQDPKTGMVIYHINKSLDIFPTFKNEVDKKKYIELMKLNYTSIKSVYIGSFLNRLIRYEPFELCLKSSYKCTMRYIDILRYGLDVPSVQNYYEIKNSKRLKKKACQNDTDIRNKILENRFVLDCTNVNIKKKNYNSLLDENCVNFLNLKGTKKILVKQGFINKKGKILKNPEISKDKIYFITKKGIENVPSLAKNFSFNENIYNVYLPRIRDKKYKSPNVSNNKDKWKMENCKENINKNFLNLRKRNFSYLNINMCKKNRIGAVGQINDNDYNTQHIF